MRKSLLSLTIILFVLALQSATCHAQTRRYEVYRSDRFGIKRDALRPDAVIEIDEQTDSARMYDTDRYGFPDIRRDPTYVIESSPFNSLLDTNSSSDEDCEHDDHDSRRHRFHDDDDHDDDHDF